MKEKFEDLNTEKKDLEISQKESSEQEVDRLLDIVAYEVPIPPYFKGSKGMENVEKIENYISKAFREPIQYKRDILGTRESPALANMPDCLKIYSRRFGLSAEGLGFYNLVGSGDVDKVTFFVAEPDFKNYYWSKENREKVASLVMGMFAKGRFVAGRVFLIHVDGDMIGIDDFGATDVFASSNNVKYRNILQSMGQYINEVPREIIE